MAEKNNNNNGRIPFVNPVKCLNNEGGHNYQYEMRVEILAPKVDSATGKIEGTLEKKYILEMVCKEHNCGSRLFMYEKTVDMDTNISLAEMLSYHKANLAEAYYAEHPEKRPSGR